MEPSDGAKARLRQKPDAAPIGSRVSATVAPNDPGAGFVNDAAVRAFRQGRMLFDQEKFPEAILAFSAFLEGNPNHALASAAQYAIGEAYYREGDYAVADTEFRKLTARYPQSPRASYALVRLSQSALALGKNDEARRYRTEAEGLFPKSPALKLLRESPTPSVAADADQSETPIATAPDLSIERPTVPAIAAPTIEKPSIEAPTVEAPHVEAPVSNAPRARVGGSNGDLDAPPGSGG
jgi:tol-pal system protein YbgF